MFRLPIAMSLFGLQQVQNLLLAPDGSRAARALEPVTRALGRELGDRMERLFETGDRLQRSAIDRLFEAIPGGPDAPRRFGVTSLRLLRQSADTAARVAPVGGDLWRELANKLEAFETFQQAGPHESSATLGDRLRRTAAMDPWLGLWAREGLGYEHADAAWNGERPPDRLLAGPSAGELPSSSLIAVHTGMGLLFAERLLDELPVAATEARLEQALDCLVRLVRDQALPGYEEVAFESLGLVTRTLHPHLLRRVDGCLERRDRLLAELFRHGVGRALYFSPSNALPRFDSGWRAVGEVLADPAERRAQVLAGLAWALTLVNLRDPSIVERFLDLHAGEIGDLDAVRQGVAAAVLVWRDAVGDDACLRKFLEHGARRPRSRSAHRWAGHVEGPARAALRRVYPALASARRLGTLFRYHRCDRWLERPLEARRPSDLCRGAEDS